MINKINERLYISTIADDAVELARRYTLGLEIAEFCTAFNMDTDFNIWDNRVKRQMDGVNRFIFHAPFNELCPAAIDPMIAEVAKKRYAQAYVLMDDYGINAMVVHSGYLPALYHKNWFTELSVKFWKQFLSDKPDNFRLYLENVFEPNPDLLVDIIKMVNDKRFCLCLDTGHAAKCDANADVGGWMLRTLPYLGHVHLHNNDGSRDAHNALGDGIIDMAGFIRDTADAAPDVTFTIETVYAKESVEWLKDNNTFQD